MNQEKKNKKRKSREFKQLESSINYEKESKD